MSSCPWWEQVSAGADGELAEPERSAADAHASRCPSCTASLGAAGLLRRSPEPMAVSARPVPGLDTEGLTSSERRWLSGRWARRLLLVAAIVIVIEALPSYFQSEASSAEAHAARHLAAWQIGFGVGLFVAAWVSRMSHAMLALAATFATLTVVATAIDVVSGHSGPLAEPVHLVELIAVFLLWWLTPPHLLPWHHAASGTDRAPATTRRDFRLVNSDPGEPE
jgi:predicted anti-sigma-YlaC factor YlaD